MHRRFHCFPLSSLLRILPLRKQCEWWSQQLIVLCHLPPRESSWEKYGGLIVLQVNFKNKYGSFVLPLIEFQYKILSSHYIFTINCMGLKIYHADPSQLLNLSFPNFVHNYCNLPARLHLKIRSSILINV